MKTLTNDPEQQLRDDMRASIYKHYRLGPDRVLTVLEALSCDVRQWKIEGWEAERM